MAGTTAAPWLGSDEDTSEIFLDLQSVHNDSPYANDFGIKGCCCLGTSKVQADVSCFVARAFYGLSLSLVY